MNVFGRRPKARFASTIGRRAERLALLWLAAKGYRPLARRFGGKGGEIDLIVKRGRTVAFVEVKARGAIEDAVIAITPQKRRLVESRIRQWLAQIPGRWTVICGRTRSSSRPGAGRAMFPACSTLCSDAGQPTCRCGARRIITARNRS
jgi:putative endonuclease